MAKDKARGQVLDGLRHIMSGQSNLDTVLEALYGSALSSQDKAFARQLLMVVLRQRGQLEALIKPYLKKPLGNKLFPVQLILLMGAAQLRILKTPAHAAIDTSVALAKAGGFQHQAGLVNAILRKVAADDAPLANPIHNCPDWLRKSWQGAYGKKTAHAMAEQLTHEPPLDISLKPEAALEEGEPLLANHRRLNNQNIKQIPGYEAGEWWVQDVAASLPICLLGDVAGKTVLDLCAAPGGKTLQLAAAGADVMAVDRSAERLKRVQENLMRCQLSATIIEADLRHWQPETSVDAILLDAPCSATGTVRRHPDIHHVKGKKDVQDMVALQRTILSKLLEWLPVNIPLVYCVCSLQPEEGEQQIDWLLEQDTSLSLQPIDMAELHLPPEWQPRDGMIRTLPHYWSEKGGMDGFFMAKLIRH